MTTMDLRGRVDLSVHGIHHAGPVVWNASTPVLYEHAIARGEARIGEGGPMVVDTGICWMAFNVRLATVEWRPRSCATGVDVA